MTTRAILSIIPSLLILFASTAAAQSEPPSVRTSCLSLAERTTTTSVADAGDAWITEFDRLQRVTSQRASATLRLSLTDVVVDGTGEHGFWISAGDGACRLYVRPAEGDLIRVRDGELVSVQGEIRYAVRQGASNGTRRELPYLYSYIVRPAWYPGANGPAEARR